MRERSMVLGSAMLATVSLCASASAVSTASFEGYSEGRMGYGFTDGPSGILFSQPVSYGNGGFYIEHGEGSAYGLQPIIPGNYLTADGIAPGNDFGANPWGFKATFPQVTHSVDMDVMYWSAGGTLVIRGFSETDQLLLETRYTLPTVSAQPLATTHIHFAAQDAVKSIRTYAGEPVLSPGAWTGIGYDNIAFPEPGSLALAALGATTILRRRAR